MESEILREFYMRYSREIYLYLLGMCKDSYLAEDLMQESFVKALLSLRDDHENARAWLYNVARNLCLNELRKRKYLGSESPEELSLASDEETALEQYLRNEAEQKLYRALRKLDERKREVILLQYFSVLSQKEIARVMGLTHENVRVISHRAKRKIKEILEEVEHEI